MKRLIFFALLVACFMVGVIYAQAPGDPSKVPQQLKLERQNELLRLQHQQDKIQTDYDATGCQAMVQKAGRDYQDLQVKISNSETEGLKEIGLDPAKYVVQPNTFYVVEKPADDAKAKK